MTKLRYFIFHYRCHNSTVNVHGQYGNWNESLLSLKFVTEEIAKNSEFTPMQVNILGFNEVSEADYNVFFGKEKVA